MGGKAHCCRQKEGNPSHNGPLMGFGSFLWLNLGPPAAWSVKVRRNAYFAYHGNSRPTWHSGKRDYGALASSQWTDQQGPGGKVR